MTIKQRGREGICTSAFTLDGTYHVFTFNDKKGMPLITEKRKAREYELQLKGQLRAGTFVMNSPLRNFGKFYSESFLGYSRENKSKLAQDFDRYYGEILLEEFGRKDLGDITLRMIENFLLKLSRTKTKYNRYFSPVTIRMIYDRINQLYNQAIGERVYLDNPCRLVKKSVLKKFPSWQPRRRWLNKYDPEEEERLFKEPDPRLQTFCRLSLNTGLRPPKEILLAEKSHVNLTDKSKHYRFTDRDGEHLAGQHALIPPRAILFAYSDGSPIKSVKKGFARACERAVIENLRPYDLRGTFATRLAERYVPMDPIISPHLGHTRSSDGFGHASRITPGYTQATWEAMVRAVESLEYPPEEIMIFGRVADKIGTNQAETGTGRGREAVAN